MVPSLRRSERRALTEDGDEALFRALFHGPAPSLDRFARAVHAAGLSPFFPRPLPSGAGRLASNRKLSSGLTLAGELWLRLGRPESHAQVLFRAARKIDRDTHDLARLATEGNLGVVKWLDPDSREVVRQLSTRGRSDLLEALRAEYLSDSAS